MSKVTIQGDASGTGIFTIASPNSNTDRTLVLPDEAGTVLTTGSTNVVTSAMQTGDAIPIGVGQTWQDVSGSRAFGTTYTNTTGRPITVAVGASGNAFANMDITLIINNVTVRESRIALNSDGSAQNSLMGIVPNGQTYRVDVTSGAFNGFLWTELR